MLRALLLLLLTPALFAQGDEIRAMLKVSEAAWNRGDLESFVLDYDDSPETTFIGRTVTRGSRSRQQPRTSRVGLPSVDGPGRASLAGIRPRSSTHYVRTSHRQAWPGRMQGYDGRSRSTYAPLGSRRPEATLSRYKTGKDI